MILNLEEKDVVRMEAGPGSSHKLRNEYNNRKTAMDNDSIKSNR